ncbi:MAG: hypothetical protein BWK73_30275 [Thiothrix lacustris]|uniref:Tetratricopeptide repeat protein n=1 Tax=Thiothrix lacustris TaxID=525917 RepID=A0A1Y1QJ78_9GAMM|nr:MAG: hypothetical protein BWK73_30275 [Thiothrix lacustris]
MHILRWLMKHPIMLAWLLAIVAILLNFGIGGKPAEHGGKEMAAKPEQTHVAPKVDAGHTAAQQHVAPAEVAVVPVQAATQPAPAAAAMVQAVEVPAAPVQAAEVPKAAAQAAEAPVVATPAPAAEQAAPAQAVEAPAVVATPAQAAPAQQASANAPSDLLRAAREAYWANELDRAVGLYTDLLKQTPDSLDYKGELANVYWKQGNAEQASTLFADIAPKLAAQGRTTEALNMKLYVDMVNPELAKQIDAALKK